MADLEKMTEPIMPEEEFLFRPLPNQSRKSGGQILTSGQAVSKGKAALREREEQFFEL